MSFTLAASRAYTVSCDVFYQVSALTGSPGINLTFTGPASPTNVIFGGYEAYGNNNATYNSVVTSFSTSLFSKAALVATPTNLSVHISGTIETSSGNSGTLQLQYANIVSSTSSVTVKRGS